MIVLNSKSVEFTPKTEEKNEKPATFIVKPPTREVILKIQDILQETLLISGNDVNPDKISQTFKFSEYAKLLLDECIVGWKNIYTENEKGELIEIPFSKENLNLITDINTINELITFIDSLGSLGK